MKQVSRGAKLAIVGFGLLLAGYVLLAFIVISSFASPPQVTPRIEVVRDNRMSVPEEVTVGERFAYRITGNKLVDNGAEVRLQLSCIIDNTESISSVAVFYSDIEKGRYDVSRNMVIIPSPRVADSDNCHLESIATYTFYQVDRFGQEQSINVPLKTESNTFKLVVPEEEISSLENSPTPALPLSVEGGNATNSPAAPSTAGRTSDSDEPSTPNDTVGQNPSDPNMPRESSRSPVTSPSLLELELDVKRPRLLDLLLSN